MFEILYHGDNKIDENKKEYLLFSMSDSITEHFYYDHSFKSNCVIYMDPFLLENKMIKDSYGYFSIGKNIFFIRGNEHILSTLFSQTNQRQKFYYDNNPSAKVGGFNAWHVILQEDMNLIFVGYELSE